MHIYRRCLTQCCTPPPSECSSSSSSISPTDGRCRADIRCWRQTPACVESGIINSIDVDFEIGRKPKTLLHGVHALEKLSVGIFSPLNVTLAPCVKFLLIHSIVHLSCWTIVKDFCCCCARVCKSCTESMLQIIFFKNRWPSMTCNGFTSMCYWLAKGQFCEIRKFRFCRKKNQKSLQFVEKSHQISPTVRTISWVFYAEKSNFL